MRFGLTLRRLVCLALMVMYTGLHGSVSAQEVIVPESECKVKYVYLYSFALLTKWPERAFTSDDAPFVIGVLGDKPYGEILDAIAKKKKIGKRPIRIRRFKTLKDYEPCHILYVTEDFVDVKPAVVCSTLKKEPVMIVGETPGNEKSGSVATFHLDDGKVRFSLNMDAAHKRNLVVTARLSRLARPVQNN